MMKDVLIATTVESQSCNLFYPANVCGGGLFDLY